MAESVEVRPRYIEPDAPHVETTPVIAPPAPVSPAVSAARGIFTSMYENKIIVLIIVIVIIIIGIIAYVVYRKPEDDSDKPNSKLPAPTPNPPPNPTPNPVDAPTEKPTEPSQSTAAPKMDKNNLRTLLARSKGGAQPAPIAVVEESQGSKTDTEIMQLMEDDEDICDDHDDQDIPSEDLSADEEASIDDTADDAESTGDDLSGSANSQSASCSQMLPIGRQCRVKAVRNGKCKRHSK